MPTTDVSYVRGARAVVHLLSLFEILNIIYPNIKRDYLRHLGYTVFSLNIFQIEICNATTNQHSYREVLSFLIEYGDAEILDEVFDENDRKALIDRTSNAMFGVRQSSSKDAKNKLLA